MSQWKTMPNDVPLDDQTVWVRLRDWQGPPFLAVYLKSSQSFRSITEELIFPWYIVARWKPVL